MRNDLIAILAKQISFLMGKKNSLFIIIGGLLISLSAFTVVVKSNGEKWRTGSPWDGTTCSSCHNGGASTPTVSITAVPAFGSGNTYVAGTTYTITTTVAGSYAKYGFNLEILNSTALTAVKDAGVFGSVISANTQKYATTNLPTTISHSAPANGVFSFTWTAPDTGMAYLYCAGLGVNNDGATSGDKVVKTTLTLMNSLSSLNEITTYRPDEINLNVFPNPATDQVQISYAINKHSDVSIKLFNLKGELVSDLLNESQNEGTHSLNKKLPPALDKGIYLLRLCINGQFTSQKILVY